MSIVIYGLDMDNPPYWYGWSIAGIGTASGFVDPASRGVFFDELKIASQSGEITVRPAQGDSPAWRSSLYALDTATGHGWWGPGVGAPNWLYQGDNPAMSLRLCCANSLTVHAITCANASTVGTPFSIPEPGLETGATGWYDGIGGTSRGAGNAHSGSWSSGPTNPHRWKILPGTFSAGKRYVVRFWQKPDAGAETDTCEVGYTAAGDNVHVDGLSDRVENVMDTRPNAGVYFQRCLTWTPTVTRTSGVRLNGLADGYVDDLEVFEGGL